MKTRPEISDGEIHSMMDFDKVLDKHRSAKKIKTLTTIVGSGVIIALIVGWAVFKPTKQTVSVVPPEMTKPVTSPEPQPIKEQEIKDNKPVEIKVKPKQEAVPTADATDVYTEAEPVNGYPDLYAYFQKELSYPVDVLKDSIEGTVSVSFVINKDGRPEQIKILNSLGTPFDNEAVRVINSMPQWKAASLNGKPVPVRMSMPLTFQINRTSKPQ